MVMECAWRGSLPCLGMQEKRETGAVSVCWFHNMRAGASGGVHALRGGGAMRTCITSSGGSVVSALMLLSPTWTRFRGTARWLPPALTVAGPSELVCVRGVYEFLS